ncbi:MAG: bifunctional precorrin-2 dehydrogenase/sirohydrochlorin ferrochelatase [Peptococcaceae bacterium]|nr:bifunctional precorrin-2 dehydrogenase/sirohydrochlorin ferrochelatase [Peptococcaceae bacterium]
MSFSYPVTLNLKNRCCIVIGGGSVALRKVKSLLTEEANVTVISPVLHEELQHLYEAQHSFTWIAQLFQEEMLNGSFLVIAATNNREVNHRAAVWCEAHQVLVNVADSREESSFTVNAAVRRGDLLIAVSTDGASPAISRGIRMELETQFGEEYAIMLEIAESAREEAMRTIPDEKKRREFLQHLADMRLQDLLKTETKEEVQKRVELCLSSYWA